MALLELWGLLLSDIHVLGDFELYHIYGSDFVRSIQKTVECSTFCFPRYFSSLCLSSTVLMVTLVKNIVFIQIGNLINSCIITKTVCLGVQFNFISNEKNMHTYVGFVRFCIVIFGKNYYPLFTIYQTVTYH